MLVKTAVVFITVLVAHVSATCRGDEARLLLIGGYRMMRGDAQTTVDAFCLPSETPTTVAQLPSARKHHRVVTVNGLVYVLGGGDLNSTVLKFLSTVYVYAPPPNDTWFLTTPMGTERGGLGACAIGNKIYAIGGQDGWNPLASGEVFDTTTKLWTPIKPMATKRTELAVGVLRGQIYAVGGMGEGMEKLSSVERYDPQADEWSRVSPLQESRWDHAAVVVNEKLYAISTDGLLATVEVYGADTDQWSFVKDAPLNWYWSRGATYGGLIYVAGVADREDAVAIFDPIANAWNSSKTMHFAKGHMQYGVAVAVV